MTTLIANWANDREANDLPTACVRFSAENVLSPDPNLSVPASAFVQFTESSKLQRAREPGSERATFLFGHRHLDSLNLEHDRLF